MEKKFDVSDRRRCRRCGVHTRICVCRHCTPVSGAPRLWVLQHPSEVAQSKGTLRIARACLPNLQVLVGESDDDFAELRRQADPARSAVLFPSSRSQPLEASQPELAREWILIDGTWRKAKRILLANPWLQNLPGFHFQSAPASDYRIRKSGPAGGLSTVEAIGYLLSLTHPACETQPLQRGLDALVRTQLAQMPQRVRQRYG